MILIDMPMPEKCRECPCAYWIMSGEYEGLLMCNALEWRDGSRQDVRKAFLVEEWANKRPEKCPIKMEVIR